MQIYKQISKYIYMSKNAPKVTVEIHHTAKDCPLVFIKFWSNKVESYNYETL